jgi:phosphoglycerate dehydrogenase-like enzyme
MKPKIVVAHWPGQPFLDLDVIDGVGTVLDPEPIGRWDDPRADALLAEAEVILGHWGCPFLDASVLDRAPHVGLFAYAAGTIKETVSRDVFGRVRITTGAPANAEPVAEFTLAAILFANKDVLWRRDAMRDPTIKSRRQRPTVPVGSWDKTIGIVGASLVGRRVIELLRAFPHLRVTLYDPFVSVDEARELGVEKLELNELCATSDVLSIHAPNLPSTRHMIAAPQLAALRTGATVINTARGALLDHDALVDEVEAGRLYAILDVTDPEPLPDDHPLRTNPSVFLTPHLAGSQGTELRRMTHDVAEEIRRWSAGEPAINEITVEVLDRLA